MGAYLLTWNPKKYLWDRADRATLIERSRAGIAAESRWSCSRSGKPQRGDRAFLMMLGSERRGIFASGWLTRGSHKAPEGAFGPQSVEVQWDVFLDPEIDQNRLDPSEIGNQHWTPENSGAEIKQEAHRALELMWHRHLAGRDRRPAAREFSDDEGSADESVSALEGALRTRMVRHRLRERGLREAKLEEFRAAYGRIHCEVCGLDFFQAFSVLYAEVHHLKPLADQAAPRLTRTADLAVLCANCHRVAHLDPKKVLSLDELRQRRNAR